MGFFKRKFRNIKKFPTWIFWLPAKLLQLYLLLFFRVKVEDPNGYLVDARGRVALMWHNRLFFFAVIFPKHMRVRTVAVVSASRDGQYITDFISHLGLRSMRGSSSRQGSAAQRGAIKAIKENCNVAITPDGPRGPKYTMKPGPIHLASQIGTEVVPMSVNASRYWQIRSWDNFQIPKPFSTLTLVLGDGVKVPEGLSSEQLEKYRKEVEQALLTITKD